MLEDLVNLPPFTSYLEWRRDRQLDWDGPLAPQLPWQQARQWQRTAEGRHRLDPWRLKAALPPLLPYGLEPDQHFVLALERAQCPTPFEQSPSLDDDLLFAAEMAAHRRTELQALRRDAVGRLRELKRRVQPLTRRLRRCQTSAIRRVTARRDLGLLAVLVVISVLE